MPEFWYWTMMTDMLKALAGRDSLIYREDVGR